MLTPAPSPATPRAPPALPFISLVCTVRLFPVLEGGLVLSAESAPFAVVVTTTEAETGVVPSHAAVVLVPVVL